MIENRKSKIRLPNKSPAKNSKKYTIITEIVFGVENLITHLDNVVQIIIVWPEWGDSNARHPAPKCVSEPSAGTLPPSLALSSAWAVPF